MKDTTKSLAMYLHKSYINSDRFDKLYTRSERDIIERESGRLWEFVEECDEYVKFECEVAPCYH